MKRNFGVSIVILIMCFTIIGSYFMKQKNEAYETAKEMVGYELIYTETICPNEEYVQREEDKIYYTIKVFQNQDNRIMVSATSNSAFFDGDQYELECLEKISAENVSIEWLTLMGEKTQGEKNQFSVANVVISMDDEVLNERMINFGAKVIEMVTDVINKNKPQ